MGLPTHNTCLPSYCYNHTHSATTSATACNPIRYPLPPYSFSLPLPPLPSPPPVPRPLPQLPAYRVSSYPLHVPRVCALT